MNKLETLKAIFSEWDSILRFGWGDRTALHCPRGDGPPNLGGKSKTGEALLNAMYFVELASYNEFITHMKEKGGFKSFMECFDKDENLVYILNFLQEKYGDKQ